VSILQANSVLGIAIIARENIHQRIRNITVLPRACFILLGHLGDFDAAIQHHFLDVFKAEVKSAVQPDAVGDNLGRKSVPLVVDAHFLKLT
jgi:hypothetical protein